MRILRLMPMYVLQGIVRIGGPRAGDAYLEICDRVMYEACLYAEAHGAVALGWVGGKQ